MANHIWTGLPRDTLHAAPPFDSSPPFIAPEPRPVSNDTEIDLVFTDFIGKQLTVILNTLHSSKKFTTADMQSYSPYLVNQVLGICAQQTWSADLTA